jgi:GNAT superfamily N-acetyltransferase
MEVREIKAAELAQLVDLYSHLHEKDEPLPSPEAMAAVWREIGSNDCIRYFGLFLKDVLVSSCTITLVPNLTRGCRPYGLIENVVTHPQYRGNGYASKVLSHALEYAWTSNSYKVMLMTGRLNEATFSFYESVGFSRHEKQAFIAKPISS